MKNSVQDSTGTVGNSQRRNTSDAQQEILASVALGDEASCAFNMAVQIDFPGAVDAKALAAAVKDLGARHQMLRARFSLDGESMWVDRECQVELQDLDLRAETADHAASLLDELRDIQVAVAFDLVNNQAWRVHLVLLSDGASTVLITAHHVVADGWSLAVMREDLAQLYTDRMQKRASSLQPAIDFDVYLEYLDEQQRNGTRGKSRDYWIEQFTPELSAFDFPLDHARPAVRSYAAGRCDVRIPRDVSDALRLMAREQQNSLFNVLFSAFYAYLYRASAANDLVVGIPAAGHSIAGLYEMVGHCVNILPVRQSVQGEQSFAALLRDTRSSMLDAQDNQVFTFSEMIGHLDVKRDLSRIPVVSMLFNIDQETGKHDYAGLQGQANSIAHRFENFEIFCNILDRQGELTVEWAYNTQLFSAESTEHRVRSFVALLSQIATAPELLLDDTSLFSEADRQVYSELNNTSLPLPAGGTVLSMLEASAQQSPNADALVAGNTRFSYRELHQRANRLANYLQLQGVSKGDWVALCLQRSEHMVVAILALMKLGATYVPLDPAYPAERVAYIIENASASMIITQSNLLAALPQHAGSNVCLDALTDQLRQQADTAPEGPLPSAEDLIYVIYTSGSTGNPKGVKLEHANVANFLSSMAREPGLVASDRLVAVTTLSFDIAVLELMLPLTVGACVVLATREQATDAEALQALMQDEGATTLQATPATWRMLLQGGWQGQQNLKSLVGGEALPRDLALQLVDKVDQLWNMYGPTETAIWSTCERIDAGSESITIGKPIGNTQVYVFDQLGHPAPVGMPGELLIGGEGVCAGYHQRDDLNRQVFIPDIFSSRPAAKLYRTRDRVKLLPDGRVEYLERMDNQVKVRGYRIELGEIETVLGEQDAVQECAVLAREDVAGDVRLVAYVLTIDGQLNERALALGLRERLPEFMQPQHFVLMQDMPRTPNGKLDRKALPPPRAREGAADETHIEPRTDTERWVANHWSELILAEGIGVDDNFFALGGHSLLAMRFIAESRKQFPGAVSLQMVLRETLAQIAATLDPKDRAEIIASDQQPTATPIKVFFSVASEKPMFCSYHPPADGRRAHRAVLMVQSLGHEYQRGHRAMQELATALSKEGCAVLRFDYCNTGDSSGEPEQLSLPQLQRDLKAATDELIRLSGCASVDLLSMRLGSLLVASHSDARWNRHFAWDPVLSGAGHARLLKQMQLASLRDWDRYVSRRKKQDSAADEFLGYTYTETLLQQLSEVQGGWLPSLSLIVSSGESTASDQLDVVSRLTVEPQWQSHEHSETHIQMPGDLEQLVQDILEISP